MIEIEGPMLDALEMVRRIRDDHTRQLEGATSEEIIRFHRERADLLHSSFAPSRAAREPRRE